MPSISECLCIIPARSGSTRIPNKNFRPLAGGPSLVERTIRVALACGFEQIVVSTDVVIPEPLGWLAHQPDVHWFRREPELAQGTTPMIDVVKDVLEKYPDGDPVVLLQPTSPFRTVQDIRDGLTLHQIGHSSVVGVVPAPDGWPVRDGSFYIFRRGTIKAYNAIYTGTLRFYWMNPDISLNINTPEDWAEAERRLAI